MAPSSFKLGLIKRLNISLYFTEKLRRKDLEVSRALEEKQRLIADILHIPFDDFEHIVDIASQPTPDRDAREVLLAALAQGELLVMIGHQRLGSRLTI